MGSSPEGNMAEVERLNRALEKGRKRPRAATRGQAGRVPVVRRALVSADLPKPDAIQPAVAPEPDHEDTVSGGPIAKPLKSQKKRRAP